ncbi:MAG TPA: glycosyltransferase family 39 protein [Thermoanaerobaculia bacterium]|jgi:hypothetical protein|nr:glycosyltransferase family 39 protein [Thermoanaerobaculia bacterium]
MDASSPAAILEPVAATSGAAATRSPRTRGARLAALAGGAAVPLLALAKLAIHLATTGAFGYRYFVDELYFLACARHLAWGYVDMPPLFPALTALVSATLGESLLAIRLVPALAGAALVLMTGRLARELGGGRFAQVLAALAVLTAPAYLALHSIYTMNCLEPLLWTGCAWVLVRLVHGGDARLWLLFGALTGVGMLNKQSMAFFAVAAAGAVLATPLRRALRGPWPWLGAALALALCAPNLVWDAAHGFPHLEMLRNIAAQGRDVELSPLAFLAQQVLYLDPLALPLWLGGLLWTVSAPDGKRYRVLGLTWLGVIAEMLLLHGRPYYPMPAYPMLLAAGGVAFERWLPATAGGMRRLLRRALPAVLVAAGAVLAPLVLPCLPPELYVRYAHALGFGQPRIETHRLGPLPQLFADRFGWPEMAHEVARIYHALPPADRAQAAIFGQNYGQAGAIDLFGPRLGLPPALSGHLSYWWWGPHGASGQVMIVLDDDRETLERIFADVRLAGHVSHPYSMPYQHFDVFVCRRPRVTLQELWPQLKQYH